MSVLKISSDNIDEILSGEKTVLIDFYADWCGPCRTMSKIVEEIAEENPDIIVGKINVEDEPELTKEFRVGSIPNFVVLKDRVLVNRLVGAKPKAQILEMLKD